MSAPDPTPHADHDAISAGTPAAAATATAAPTAQGRSVTPAATGLRAAPDGRSSAGHSRTPHGQHIQGARPPRPRVIELSLLLLTAIALGCVGMAGALNGLWWLPSVAATLLTVLVVTGAARWLRVPSPLVTVLGLAALLLASTVVHLPSHALLGFIPTGETFTAAGELWRSSGDFISRDAAPYGPNPGLAFVLCTLVGLVTVFMETVLVGLRMAGLACLGVLALLVLPALTLPGSVTALGLAAAALAALALLAGSRFWGATRAQRIAPTPGGLPRALLVIAGVLAVVLFIPAVMPGFFNGAFPQGSSFTAERASGVGPLRAVGQDLRSDEHTRRFSYTTSDDQPQYMRLLTLSDFDQDEWFPDVENLDGDLSGLADAARNPVPRGTEVSAKVMFDDFSEHWLPAPYAPVAVSGLGDEGWAWNPRDLSIFSESTGMSGAEYTVTSALSRATPEALRTAPSAASDPQLGGCPRTAREPPAIGRGRRAHVHRGCGHGLRPRPRDPEPPARRLPLRRDRPARPGLRRRRDGIARRVHAHPHGVLGAFRPGHGPHGPGSGYPRAGRCGLPAHRPGRGPGRRPFLPREHGRFPRVARAVLRGRGLGPFRAHPRGAQHPRLRAGLGPGPGWEGFADPGGDRGAERRA